MRNRTLLACRWPPQLSRMAVVFPLDAETGETPQRAANAASEVMRSGLSPAVASSVAATIGPTPGDLAQLRVGLGGQLLEFCLELLEVSGQSLALPAQGPQGHLGRRGQPRRTHEAGLDRPGAKQAWWL